MSGPFSTTSNEQTAPVTTVMVTEDQIWPDGLAMGHLSYFAVRPRLLSQCS